MIGGRSEWVGLVGKVRWWDWLEKGVVGVVGGVSEE